MEEKEKSKYELQQEAEQKEQQDIQSTTATWLQTDSKVKAYLSRFREADVKSFLKQYPVLKSSFMFYGERIGDAPQEHQLHYVEKAGKNLMDIQRKKIFDLMCQWDAEELKLEGIVCIDDFDPWLDDPNTCPHISPVDGDELERYLQFMETDEFKDSYHYLQLSYDEYRDDDPGDDSELYEWCMYDNLHTKHGEYFSLPMVRSRKEEVYRKLYYEERDKEIEKAYETGERTRYVPDTREELSCHYYSHLEAFIKQNESKEVLDRFRKMYDYYPDQLIRDDADDQEEGEIVSKVDRILYELEGIKEKIPIEANSDWRLGLIEAYEKYEHRQLVSGLQYAYSEYRMRIDLHLSFEEKEKENDGRNPDYFRNQILRGRALNGEAEDFDF